MTAPKPKPKPDPEPEPDPPEPGPDEDDDETFDQRLVELKVEVDELRERMTALEEKVAAPPIPYGRRP
jgi:hypothetical protein